MTFPLKIPRLHLQEVARELRKYDWQNFKNGDLKRMFKKMTDLGYAALPEAKFTELLDAISSMSENYATAKVCDYKNRDKCDLALEPELTEIFATSRDPEELKYYWAQWYDKAGTPTREAFDKYIKLSNEAAKLNSKNLSLKTQRVLEFINHLFSDLSSGAEAWLDAYEDETFEQQADAAIEQIRPLYEQIHAYVRHKLRERYGEDVVAEKGPIPMHLLGNMWAQTWDNVADFTTPYPNSQLMDVTEEMVKQGYTAKQMFEMGDDFFVSLNMTRLPQ